MAKISTYSLADEPLQLSDRLIGTEAPRPVPSTTPLATRNFSLGELLQLFSQNFPAASLQAVLDTGNTATQNITLVGNIDSTSIEPNNIKDIFGNEGTTFQFLSKATNGINWVDLPTSNLQQILNRGNTATQNIILTGNISSTLINAFINLSSFIFYPFIAFAKTGNTVSTWKSISVFITSSNVSFAIIVAFSSTTIIITSKDIRSFNITVHNCASVAVPAVSDAIAFDMNACLIRFCAIGDWIVKSISIKLTSNVT